MSCLEKKVFKWLLSFAKKYRKEYVMLLICLVIENMIQTGIMMYFQLLGTEIFRKKHTLINVVLLLGVCICVCVSRSKEKISRKVPEKIKNGMILEYYKKLHTNEIYYRENGVGKCLSMITAEIDVLQGFYGKTVINFSSNIIKLMLSLIGMLLLFPALAMIYIIILMLYAMIWNLLEKKRIVLVKREQNSRMNMNEDIYNYIEAFVETKVYQSMNWQLDYVKKAIKTYNRALVNSSMNGSLLKAAQEFLIHVSIAVVFVVLIFTTGNQGMQIGFIVSFMLYLFTNIQAFIQMISSTLDIKSTIYQGEKMYTFFADNNPEERNQGKLVQRIEKMQIKDVAYRYNFDYGVLENINIDVDLGNHIAFVGRSGCGKSTLLKIASGILEPSEGAVFINGEKIMNYSKKSLREKIGFLFQENYIFAMSIRENIKMGNLKVDDDKMIEAAKKAFIHDDIMKLPNGYDTVLDEKGNNLSGGQKQRIALARVFVKNPDILFMDEATSALDYETESSIVKIIETEFADKMILMVAHRLETVKNIDKIYYFENGKIVSEGTYNQLIQEKAFNEFVKSGV